MFKAIIPDDFYNNRKIFEDTYYVEKMFLLINNPWVKIKSQINNFEVRVVIYEDCIDDQRIFKILNSENPAESVLSCRKEINFFKLTSEGDLVFVRSRQCSSPIYYINDENKIKFDFDLEKLLSNKFIPNWNFIKNILSTVLILILTVSI